MQVNRMMKDEVFSNPIPDQKKNPSWMTSVLLFVLFLVTLAVYYPSLHGGFLNIDDLHYIEDNEYIRDLSLLGIYKIFTSVIVVNYFPLQILSYAIDYHFWGLNPFGYRLGNLIFHLGNAFLVFFLLRRLLAGRTWLAFAGSLIFSLHPVNVESVAWVSERKNVLSVFFLLLSFLAYIRYLEEKKRKGLAYGLCLGLYLLAILAKVSSVVFPLLLILYDMCFTTRSLKEWIKDKIAFFLMSAFFSGLAVYIYHLQKIIPEYHGGHPINNFLTMANVVVEYILSLFVPLYLNFYYDTRLVQSLGEYQILLSLSFLMLLTVLAVGWYRKERPLFFSLLWFFIPLLPVLNIVPIAILRADRYLYLPSIGFAFLLAWGIPRFLGNSGRRGSWAALGALLLIGGVFGWISEVQAGYWKSPFHLWSRVMKYIPGEARAYRALGNDARDRGKLDLAIVYYQGALQFSPKDESIMNNLGDVFLMKGQMEKARKFFEEALKQNPEYPDALNNMGIIYSKVGEDGLAIEAFEKAKKDKKNRATAANNLGVIFQKQGNLPGAIAAFKEAAEADPGFILAHNNLAVALRRDGKLDEAIAQLHRALPVQPRNFQTQFNLGRFYLEKKEPHRAAGYLTEALKSRPEDAETHFHLALALRLLPPHRETAGFHYEEAMKNERDPKARKEMEEKWKGSERGSSRADGLAPSLPRRGAT